MPSFVIYVHLTIFFVTLSSIGCAICWFLIKLTVKYFNMIVALLNRMFLPVISENNFIQMVVASDFVVAHPPNPTLQYFVNCLWLLFHQ